jgi:hypothetical protein
MAINNLNPPPIFFATDLHRLSRTLTDGYLLFCCIVNLMNSSVLIRVSPGSSVAKMRIAAFFLFQLKNNEIRHIIVVL